MTEEKNMVLCKGVCGKLKERIQDGKYGESLNKRWRDSNGKLWRGRICPDCHKIDMAGRMVKLRSKVDNAESNN